MFFLSYYVLDCLVLGFKEQTLHFVPNFDLWIIVWILLESIYKINGKRGCREPPAAGHIKTAQCVFITNSAMVFQRKREKICTFKLRGKKWQTIQWWPTQNISIVLILQVGLQADMWFISSCDKLYPIQSVNKGWLEYNNFQFHVFSYMPKCSFEIFCVC